MPDWKRAHPGSRLCHGSSQKGGYLSSQPVRAPKPGLSQQGGRTSHPTVHGPDTSSSGRVTATRSHRGHAAPNAHGVRLSLSRTATRGHPKKQGALPISQAPPPREPCSRSGAGRPLQASWAATPLLRAGQRTTASPGWEVMPRGRGNGQKQFFRQHPPLHAASAAFPRAAGTHNLNKISGLHKEVLIIKWKII